MLRCGGTPCLDQVTLNDLGWKLGTFGPKRCLEAPLPHSFDERRLVVVSHADSALVLVAYFCQERGRMRKEGSGYGVPTKLVRMITFHTRTNMSTNIHYDDGVND